MVYKATLFFPEGDILSPCYLPEARHDNRVSVTVTPGKTCRIDVTAADSTSLRASITTLTKLLSIFEKVSLI